MNQQPTNVPMDLQAPPAEQAPFASDSSDSSDSEGVAQMTKEEMARVIKQLKKKNKRDRKRLEQENEALRAENQQLAARFDGTYSRAAAYPHLLAEATFKLEHLDPEVIRVILDKFLTEELRVEAASIRPDADRLTVIYSPTQNGKSMETVALVWVNFFRYGVGSYMFLRGEASEYADFGRGVQDFNNRLRDFIERRWPDGLPRSGRPEHYAIDYAPLNSSTKQLKATDVVWEEDLANPRLKCVMRSRLLTASNVQRAVGEIGAMISQFGIDKHGFPNVAVLVDECQDLYQSKHLDSTRLEQLFFRINVDRSIRQKCQDFLNGLRLHDGEQTMARHLQLFDAVTPKTFRGLFRLVCISATPFSAILSEEARRVQFLCCTVRDDYKGWGTIPVVAVEELLQEDAPTNRGYIEFVTKTSARLLEQDRGRFGHYIYFWPQRSPRRPNLEYDQAAEQIIQMSNNYDRPVFVVLNYASSRQKHSYGGAIYMNHFGRRVFEQYMADGHDLDAQWFITRAECKRAGSATKSGQLFKDADGVERIVVTKRLGSGYVHGQHYEFVENEHGAELFLPNASNYRVRTQLSLIEHVCRCQGLQQDAVWIATIGGTLMKAGKAIKTIKHAWSATGMVAVMDETRFAVLSFVELIQGVGRVTGRRRPEETCPTLYLQNSVKDDWEQMATFAVDYWTRFHAISRDKPDAPIRDVLADRGFDDFRVPDVRHMLQTKKFSPLSLAQMPFLLDHLRIDELASELLEHQAFRELIACVSTWPDASRKLFSAVLTWLQQENLRAGEEDGVARNSKQIWEGLRRAREVVDDQAPTFEQLFRCLEDAAVRVALIAERNEAPWICRMQAAGNSGDEQDNEADDQSDDPDVCLIYRVSRGGLPTLQLDPSKYWLLRHLQYVCQCTPLDEGDLRHERNMEACLRCDWRYHSCCATEELVSGYCRSCREHIAWREHEEQTKAAELQESMQFREEIRRLRSINPASRQLLNSLSEMMKAGLDRRLSQLLAADKLKEAASHLLDDDEQSPEKNLLLEFFPGLGEQAILETGQEYATSDELVASLCDGERCVSSPTLLKAVYCAAALGVLGDVNLRAKLEYINTRVLSFEEFERRHRQGRLEAGEIYFVYKVVNDKTYIQPAQLRINAEGQQNKRRKSASPSTRRATSANAPAFRARPALFAVSSSASSTTTSPASAPPTTPPASSPSSHHTAPTSAASELAAQFQALHTSSPTGSGSRSLTQAFEQDFGTDNDVTARFGPVIKREFV